MSAPETPAPVRTVRKYQRKPAYPEFEDPTLPCFLKSCFVCKEEAKPGEQHSVHYGGVVCLSCRAFFRRCHQATRTPTFNCKKKENCLITTANRRRCQRCRYERCLKAGMKGDSVLTDEQKKVRFRKVIMKKSLGISSRKSAKKRTQSSDDEDDPSEIQDEEDEVDEVVAKDEDEVQIESNPEPQNKAQEWSQIQVDARQDESELYLSNYPRNHLHRPNQTPSQGYDRMIHPETSLSNYYWQPSNERETFKVPYTPRASSQPYQNFKTKLHSNPYSWQESQHLGAYGYNETTTYSEKSTFKEFGNIQRPQSYANRYDQNSWPYPRNVYCSTLPQQNRCLPPRNYESQLRMSRPQISEVTEIQFKQFEPVERDEEIKSEVYTDPSLKEEPFENLESFEDPESVDELESSLPMISDESQHYLDCLNNEHLESKFDHILKTHCIAIRQIMSPSVSEIVEKLGTIHSGETPAMKNITRGEFISHLVNMSERFRHFALQQKEFCQLSKHDQRLLLARNSPLYIQLYMGCYFGAATGVRQKDLIKQYQIITKHKETTNSNYINLFQFNAMIKLFREDADLDGYIRQVDVFKTQEFTTIETRSLLSYMILFDHDESLKLSSKERIAKISTENDEIFQRYVSDKSTMKFKELMKTLVKMAVFGSYNIQWIDIIQPPEIQSLSKMFVVMAYTSEEENWVKKQFSIFDEAFFSVHMGDDLMKEAMMNALGVPLSKTFTKKSFSIFMERFWRVISQNPALSSLSMRERELLRSNCNYALALLMAKLENTSNSFEQNALLYGSMDMDLFKKTYGALFKGKNSNDFKKLSLKNAHETSSIRISQDDLTEFYAIVKRLKTIVQDESIFKLLILIVLTKPDDFDISSSTISSLHWHYLLVLRRRLQWCWIKLVSFEDIMMGIKLLPRLCQILAKINDS